MSARGSDAVPSLEVPSRRFVLPSGTVLLVSPRPGAPVCAARLHVRGGSALDPDGREGLAWLTGRLTDQGSARHDEAALARLLEPAGGNLSGDASGIWGTIAGEEWPLLLDLLLELARGATFPEDAVELQRQRVLARLAVSEQDPRVQAAQRFRHLVYGKHWLGRPTSGTSESVGALRAADLRAHHAEHWRPERCVLAVCGDVDPEAVERRVRRATRGWERGTPLERRSARYPARAVRVDSFRRSRQQVHLYLGHLGVKRMDPDWPALAVMDHVLGTGPGFTSRITRRLRDELGLCYSVSADIHSSAGRQPGTFRAYIGTSPEHVATALAGFRQEMRRIQDERVGRAELQLAKDYLVGSFALGYERASRRASYLVRAELLGYAPDHLRRVPEQYAAVSAADVQRVARAHLYPDACCLSAAGPVSRKELKAALG